MSALVYLTTKSACEHTYWQRSGFKLNAAIPSLNRRLTLRACVRLNDDGMFEAKEI